MSRRKRDLLGRFAVGNDSFAQESTTFKKPRGVNPSMPSYPGSVGAMNVRGQAPPQASALSAGYSSGVIDIGSNSTSSLPVQARPWGPECNIGDYAPGALLFVRKDQNLTTFKSVADLATANWLLREARANLRFLTASSTLDENMGASSNDHPTYGWLGDLGWLYFGPMRNSHRAPGSLITLCNVDVFGRSKVGNLWGRKVTSGDRVGIALVPMNIKLYGSAMYGPGDRSRVMETYLKGLAQDSEVQAPILNDRGQRPAFADASARDQRANASATKSAKSLLEYPYEVNQWITTDFTQNEKHTVWQWMPTLGGELCDHVLRYFPGETPPDFIEHISLGVISNCLQAGRTTIPMCLRALTDTDAYTTLPQIEILIE